MILKKALAVISTATLMFTGSAVSEMYASASVVTDVKDKLNNDFFDYYSTIDSLGGYSYAKIVMESPESTLEFKNITEDELKTQKINNYTGTIEAEGETYLVARKKGNILYNTTFAEIEES